MSSGSNGLGRRDVLVRIVVIALGIAALAIARTGEPGFWIGLALLFIAFGVLDTSNDRR